MANEELHTNATAVEKTAADHSPAGDSVAHAGAPGVHGEDHPSFDPLKLQWDLFGWFFAVFLIGGWVLKKFAWQPILDGLEKRENDIRSSIENAERIKQELTALDQKRTTALAEADAKAKDILDAARKASQETARVIENKARDEANILLDNARREVKTATDKARAILRQEAAELSVGLAGKILKDQLDPIRARALNDRLIQEL